MKQLIQIQSELKAPKNQFNAFGKYKYRSCEDILEAVKPLLLKYGCTLTISDKVMGCNNLTYVESCATISNGEDFVHVTAQAGIEPNRKGMDISQSFGSSSSYARKYALNGLFLIDDTKDADSTNDHKEDNTSDLMKRLINNLKDYLRYVPLKDQPEALKAIENCKTRDQYDKLLVRFEQLKSQSA